MSTLSPENLAIIEEHSGNAWKKQRSWGNYFGKMRFPRKIFTMKNSRVPNYTINATRGLKSTGFVRPQNPLNNTFETRRRIFERNFITRIITMVEDSMLRDIPLPLADYVNRLTAPDCSRDEAIYLYDEIIAIFIILILYIATVTKDTVNYLRVNPSVSPNKMILAYNKSQFFLNLSNIFLSIRSFTVISLVIEFFSIAAMIGAPITILILPAIQFTLLAVANYEVAEKYKKRYEGVYTTEKNNLLFVIQSLMDILLDNGNTVNIKSVQDELKYWGLTRAQVEYLFSNNVPKRTFGEDIPPPILSAEELGINENERQEFVLARESAIELQMEEVEEHNRKGHILFGLTEISEFIQKANENQEVLAPNGNFSDGVVRFVRGNSNNSLRNGGATAGVMGGRRSRKANRNRRKSRR